MADLEKSVAIIFEGVDQMGAGVTSVTRQLDTVSGSVQQVAQPLADFTVAVAKAETALLATGAAVTALAVKTAGEFDGSFREITTLLGESGDSLEGLRGELLSYASDSTQSIDTITDAYYDLISAGNDTEQALALLANSEALAVGGKTDLDTAAKALAGTLSAYGAEASEAEQYTDTLFTAMAGGMTTVGELASSLPQITGLASQLGVDFDTLAAAVSALTTTGLSTSQAVTQVGAALTSIMAPSQQAKTLAEELGIEFNATALRSKGLEGFLGELAEATGGSEEKMRTLFGSTEATKGAMTLIGPVAETFVGILGDMDEKAGATATAVEKMADDIDNGLTKIKNNMTVALVNLGTPLLDEFNGIQAAIAAIFNAIGVSLDGGQLNQFVQQIESVFQDLEATLHAVAQNLPEALETADFSGFLDGFEAIRKAVSDLFDGADLSTAEGLATIIEKLGTAFNMLSQYTAGAITAIGPFLEKLGDLANLIMKIDPEWVALMGKIGGSAVVLATVLSSFSSLLNIMNNLAGAKGAIPAVTGAAGKLTGALGAKGGLVPAALAAGGALAKLYNEAKAFNEFRFSFSDELKEELDKTSGAQRAATEFSLFQIQKIADAYEGLSEFFGWGDEAADDFQQVSGEAVEAAKAVAGLGGDFQQVSGEAVDAAKAVAGMGGDVDAAVGSLDDMAAAASPAAQQVAKIEQAAIDAAASVVDLGDAEDAIKKLDTAAVDAALAVAKIGDNRAINVLFADLEDTSRYVVGLDGDLIDVNKTISTLGEVTKDAGDEADEGAKKFSDLGVELEKLASNERIKAMEFSADIAVAEIEGDVARVEAAFGSLNTGIESTGRTLSSLWGDLAGGDLSRMQQIDLEKALRAESEYREKEFKLQEKLAKQQIELMKAKTKMLNEGEGLIKIDSDGLEPALEMIMWQIIEKVQLRANAESVEFLVGINGES